MTQEKIQKLQNIFDKKINFTMKCSSQWEEIWVTFQIRVRLRETLDEKKLKFQTWFLKQNIIW